MGIANRILNIFILIFAITSVVFAYFLFEKREQLMKRGDKMAVAINKAAATLDKGTGTKFASKLNKNSLEHKKYDKLGGVLKNVSTMAKDAQEQRDALATTLKDIADKLEIPDFKAENFQLADTYKKRDKDLLADVSAVQERNNGIIAEVVATGEKVGVPLDEKTLKSDEYKPSLEKLNTKVEDVKNRHDNYSSHISEIASALEVDEPSLEGPDYGTSLEAHIEAVKDHKQKFEQSKQDLTAEKNRHKDTKTKLAETENEVEKLEKTNKKLAAIEKKLKKELSKYTNPNNEDDNQVVNKSADPSKRFLRLIKGKVLKVNKKWEFVVIDVGSKSKVTIKNGKEVPFSLPAKTQLMVARGLGKDNQFVGKIEVTKVFDGCAICSILPTPKGGSIEVGDTIYFE